MGNSQKTRPRSQPRGTVSKPWRAILAAVLGSAVVIALGAFVGLLDAPPPVQSPSGSGAQVRGIDAPIELRRPNFNYSVIPGGAFDGHELKSAVNRDTVVAQHYRDVNLSTMRPETLRADRLAYVSYRIGDRVYWTSKKVRIRSGETILTNGQTEIRARCGNCISMEPLKPTAEDEPDLLELDALTDTGPGLGSWPINAFSRLGAGEPADVETTIATAPQFGFPLSLPFDVSASPVEPIGVGPIDTEPGSSNLPGPGPGVGTPPPDGVTLPPSAATPPLVLFPTGPGFPVDDPSAFDGLDSLLDPPLPQPAPNAPNPSPLPGPAPVSVPDPASTIALLVIGLTALALAKRRS